VNMLKGIGSTGGIIGRVIGVGGLSVYEFLAIH